LSVNLLGRHFTPAAGKPISSRSRDAVDTLDRLVLRDNEATDITLELHEGLFREDGLEKAGIVLHQFGIFNQG
jgi:hypothetical protein